MTMIVTSPQEAMVAVRDRLDARLGVFPVKVWAEGHGPNKEPVVVPDVRFLSDTVEQAIHISREEHGKDGAEIEWASNYEL